MAEHQRGLEGPEGEHQGEASELERLAEAAALPVPGEADLAGIARRASVDPAKVPGLSGRGQSGARAARAFKAAREAAFSLKLAPQAMQTLSELMGAGNPPPVRLQAARFVLEVTGHRPGAPDATGGKAIEDMGSDELAALIGRLDQTLEARADAALPARAVITPDNADRSPGG
jgi:hypothetical protein